MPDPFQILFVTARYFPYVGGIETHTFEVARHLAHRGQLVTVLTADPQGSLPDAEEVEGVRVHRVRAWPKNQDYYLAPALYDRIARGSWHIVHCQGYNTFVAPLAMLAALRAGLPYVVTFHSGGHPSRLRNRLRGVQQLLLRPLLARAERLIGVSTFESELFRRRLKLPRQRFVTIPNGTDPIQVTEDRPEHGSLILSIGRLERYKGHHRVLEALPHVLAHRPDARLRIVGVGALERDLRRQAERLGVADRVEIAGVDPQDRLRMMSLISRAALVTLLSDYEAHPISVMEALAQNRPVLVSYTSGLAELADRGLVRAVPPDSDVKRVAQGILEALEHPFIPMAVDLPSWDECAERLLALYREVVWRTACAS